MAANELTVKHTVATLVGHATKASALALKSRVLLYAASPLNNPDNSQDKWVSAAYAAKQVLDLPGYGLLTTNAVGTSAMLEIWNNFFNQEVLFAMPYSNNNNFEYQNFPVGYQGGQGLTNPTQDLVDAFETTNGERINESSSYDSQNPYNQRDPRLAYFIGINGTSYSNRRVETFVGGLDGLNKDQFSTKTGYYLRKFVNVKANLVENTQAARKHWIHFRYAEILLNYAEAMNEVYGSTGTADGLNMTAVDAVNMIRSRVGMPSVSPSLSANEMRERIHNERRLELCFEGHRAWDVRRWMKGDLFNQPVHGMRITMHGTTPRYDVFVVEQRRFEAPKMYLMPIPHGEILKSDALTQNPGW